MLDQSYFKSQKYKEEQQKKLELTIAYMEVVLYGDEAVRIEDLRKLRLAGIYFSPLLKEIDDAQKYEP